MIIFYFKKTEKKMIRVIRADDDNVYVITPGVIDKLETPTVDKRIVYVMDKEHFDEDILDGQKVIEFFAHTVVTVTKKKSKKKDSSSGYSSSSSVELPKVERKRPTKKKQESSS